MPFSKPAAAARARPACQRWPTRKKKASTNCVDASHWRMFTKFTELGSVMMPPTEFREALGAWVMYSAARRTCQG